MTIFTVKKINNILEHNDLEDIGFSSNYTEAMLLKSDFQKFKIYNLTTIQANILKQTALSKGCDCATNKGCLNNSADYSDAILFGTKHQIKEIAKTLSLQQFSMSNLGKILLDNLKDQNIQKPQIMGILNLTEDSFSDGGNYLNFDKAISHAKEMIDDGADIIDIGAESTRPNAEPIEAKLQLKRIIPVLSELVKLYPDIKYSVDTRSSKVADEVLKIKDVIINDVSGLTFDNKMIDIIVKNNAKVIICHSSSTPKDMQQNTNYNNIIDDIFKFLEKQTNVLLEKGLAKENIILDVGFGFGKTTEQNFELIKNQKDFLSLGCPLLVGISRKSSIQDYTKDADYDYLTAALNGLLLLNGASIFRVHDVNKTKKTIELFSALL